MADPIASPQASYKYTGNLIRGVADEVAFIGAGEVPFLSTISGTQINLRGGKTKVFPKLDNLPMTMGNIRGNTFEWYEKDQVVTTLTSSGNITNVATTLNITPIANAAHITKGRVIVWGTEHLIADANGDGTTGQVTVKRGHAGTTAVAHTSAANDLMLLNKANIEGDTVLMDPYVPPTNYFNYWTGSTQSFSKTFYDAALARYGNSKNWKDEAIADALRTIVVGLERAAVYSLRSQGSGTVAGAFGGMNQFTSSQTSLSGATLTTAHVNAPLRAAYDVGGIEGCPDHILTNSSGKLALSKLFGNNYATISRQEDDKSAGYVVDMIRTEFGEIKVIMSPYIDSAASELWFFRKDQISIGPLRNNGVDLSFKAYDLPMTSTAEAGYIYGVYTMCFKRPTSRAKVSNFVSP